MLLENCTKQDMSESVDCQESISHAGPSCWPRNRLKTATDIASWRLILLERFKIFHFSTISRVSVFLPCYSVTLPSVAISKPGKSELVRFPSFWICGYVPDVCGICGGFAGNFLRFHGSFSDCSQQSPDT